MKLGLVTDSLVDRSLAEAAAVCRGLGLEQVELGCGNWSPAPHVDLKGLTAEGKTILMVSHDIEFCAEHGDTCALFFHGSVVTSAPAQEFFAGNSFYTTAANRMARKWYPDAVTAKDVIERCRE